MPLIALLLLLVSMLAPAAPAREFPRVEPLLERLERDTQKSASPLLPPTMENIVLGKRLAILSTAACVWPPTPITSLFLVARLVNACSMSA